MTQSQRRVQTHSLHITHYTLHYRWVPRGPVRYDTLHGYGADDGDHFTNEDPPRPLKLVAGVKRITANIMLGLSNVTFGMALYDENIKL